jgi:FMN-dependent NADH-azoreductase
MKKILHIITSPRGQASLSIQLGNFIVDKIQAAYPGSSVKESNLVQKQFPHLEEVHLNSFFTPAEDHTPEQQAAIKHSNDAIKELQEADIIVIGAPMYNFSIHSTLKAWLDHIVRRDLTFKYDENGPAGLLVGKKVYIAIASGWLYAEGPMKSSDFIEPYLRHMLGFIGLTDISIFRVEGSAIPGIQDTALEKGVNSIVID